MNYSQQIAQFGQAPFLISQPQSYMDQLDTNGYNLGQVANNAAGSGTQVLGGLNIGAQPEGKGIFGDLKLGGEFGLANLGLKGLGAIANIWGMNKQMKLAKDQFNFQKDMANANLNNTIRSYNTRLSDRARSRGFVEGQSQGQIDKYIEDNKMRR